MRIEHHVKLIIKDNYRDFLVTLRKVVSINFLSNQLKSLVWLSVCLDLKMRKTNLKTTNQRPSANQNVKKRGGGHTYIQSDQAWQLHELHVCN